MVHPSVSTLHPIDALRGYPILESKAPNMCLSATGLFADLHSESKAYSKGVTQNDAAGHA